MVVSHLPEEMTPYSGSCTPSCMPTRTVSLSWSSASYLYRLWRPSPVGVPAPGYGFDQRLHSASVSVFVRLGRVTLDSCPEPVTSCCGWQIMTIEEGRDVAAILRILRDSFGNGAVDNGM